jgi:hypothetical protein
MFRGSEDSLLTRRARLIGIFALVGFVLDLTLHILTFTSLDVSPLNILIPLFTVGMFIPFGIMVNDLGRRFGRTRFTNDEMREISAPVPAPIRTAVMVVMAYVVLNFWAIIFSRPNRQAWDAHTTIRLFTGHPLIFFLLPAVYFRYIAK